MREKAIAEFKQKTNFKLPASDRLSDCFIYISRLQCPNKNASTERI